MSARPIGAAAPRAQSGMTLVLVALMLTGLCGMAALAVDVGVFLSAKNSAQNAADAAALAGAFTFLKPANSQPTAAQNAAIAVAAANDVLGTPVSIGTGDITVDTTNQRVTVNVSRTGSAGVPGFFAAALGVLHVDLYATATAEAAPEATGSICLRPIFIPNTILSSEQPAQACTDGQTILDQQGNLTSFAKSMLGSLETIRPTSPSGALAPSQYYSLDLTNGQGNGASAYQCALGSSLADCGISPAIAACGTSYPTLNGNMKGPTQAGIGTLIGSNPDTWVGPGAYKHANGTVTDTSAALIVAPVWDDCWCSNPPDCGIGPGGGTAEIIGFSNWFVQGLGSVDGDAGVIANFVNSAGCSAGGGGNGGGPGAATNASFGIPVRLVHQ